MMESEAFTAEPCGPRDPFDLDRLVPDNPVARHAARAAEIAAEAGEMIRRARVASGFSQAELARRAGTSQAHISELERGLGPNGPTVVTLDRIMAELGQTAVFGTQEEVTSGHPADDNAEAWLAALLGAAVSWPDVEAVLEEEDARLLSGATDRAKRLLVRGALTAIRPSGVTPNAQPFRPGKLWVVDPQTWQQSVDFTAGPTMASGEFITFTLNESPAFELLQDGTMRQLADAKSLEEFLHRPAQSDAVSKTPTVVLLLSDGEKIRVEIASGDSREHLAGFVEVVSSSSKELQQAKVRVSSLATTQGGMTTSFSAPEAAAATGGRDFRYQR